MGGSFFYRVGHFSITENLWKSDLGVIILYRIVTRESLYPRVNILYDTGPCFGLVRNRVGSRDGASTIQMYSSTSTITLNMHEYEYKYEYSENKCTREGVRLLYNVLEYEYDYFRM